MIHFGSSLCILRIVKYAADMASYRPDVEFQ